MDNEQAEKQIRKLLEEPYWLPKLTTDGCYTRIHDDHDGTFTGTLSVSFTKDGDGWISMDRAFSPLRFRNSFGGGQSLRVRNALMLLAEAIRLDNEQFPQKPPQLI